MTLSALPKSLQTLADPRVIDQLSDRQIQEFWVDVFPRWIPQYMPHLPTEKQWAFLLLENREAMFGGQAGGGKSDCLLMAALQYVDVSGYAALLLRRTYADLSKPGALIPRSHEWLNGTDAHWRGDLHQWTFPSGAILDFGYLDNDNDIHKYQSSEYQFIGWDELTQFQEMWYRYLFSRLRRSAAVKYVPIRVRSATNPGGLGHNWVKRRFILEGVAQGRAFVSSRLEDNPYLNKVEYEESLADLDPVARAQLRDGDWDARPAGELFDPTWFHIIDEEEVPLGVRPIRSWDMAATKSPTSAYTAGVLMGRREHKIYIYDVARRRGDPGETEDLIRHTAEDDGRQVSIWIEQEGGSGGINTLWRYQRTVLFGYHVEAFHPRMDKVARAKPLSSTARLGDVYLVRRRNKSNAWMTAFLDEAAGFPNGFKDQIDSASQAFTALTTAPSPRARSL